MSNNSPSIGVQGNEDALKEFTTKFFYYWWNAKGNNTEEGFDDYIKTLEGKELLNKLNSPLQGNVWVKGNEENKKMSRFYGENGVANNAWKQCQTDILNYLESPLSDNKEDKAK